MREWKFWDWVSYGCIFVAALLLAAKAAENVSFMHWLSDPGWSFAPLTLVVAASALLIARALGWLGGGTKAQLLSPGTVSNPRGLTPMWKIVAHVAEGIDDREDAEAFKETRRQLRQKAVDGELKIRGLKQLENHVPTRFDDVQTDIPQSYWEISVIAPLATDQLNRGDRHTMPKEFNSWGPKGIEERRSYSDLHVDWEKVIEIWPKT